MKCKEVLGVLKKKGIQKMNEVNKSDWKLYRSKIAQWQEDYMGRLVKEYITMLQADADASEKFWELEKANQRR